MVRLNFADQGPRRSRRRQQCEAKNREKRYSVPPIISHKHDKEHRRIPYRTPRGGKKKRVYKQECKNAPMKRARKKTTISGTNEDGRRDERKESKNQLRKKDP